MAAPTPRPSSLPLSLPPRGLNREQAAAYVGVSVRKFDEMVDDGRMPPPKRVDARKLWDIRRLDEFFDRLPDEGGAANPDAPEWNFQA